MLVLVFFLTVVAGEGADFWGVLALTEAADATDGVRLAVLGARGRRTGLFPLPLAGVAVDFLAPAPVVAVLLALTALTALLELVVLVLATDPGAV